MSRSKRKTPKCGITTAVSEKQDKRKANRANRKANKQILASDDDTVEFKPLRQTSNQWAMDKDGKKYFDKTEHPDLMRK